MIHCRHKPVYTEYIQIQNIEIFERINSELYIYMFRCRQKPVYTEYIQIQNIEILERINSELYIYDPLSAKASLYGI